MALGIKGLEDFRQQREKESNQNDTRENSYISQYNNLTSGLFKQNPGLKKQFAMHYISPSKDPKEITYDMAMKQQFDQFDFYSDVNQGFEQGESVTLEESTQIYNRMLENNQDVLGYSPSKELKSYSNFYKMMIDSGTKTTAEEINSLYMQSRTIAMQNTTKKSSLMKNLNGTAYTNSLDGVTNLGGDLTREPVGAYLSEIGVVPPETYGGTINNSMNKEGFSEETNSYLTGLFMDNRMFQDNANAVLGFNKRKNQQLQMNAADEIYNKYGVLVGVDNIKSLQNAQSVLSTAYATDETGNVDPEKLRKYRKMQQQWDVRQNGFKGVINNAGETVLNTLNFGLGLGSLTMASGVSAIGETVSEAGLYLQDPFTEEDTSKIANSRRGDWFADATTDFNDYWKSRGLVDIQGNDALFKGQQRGGKLDTFFQEHGLSRFILNQVVDPINYITFGASAGIGATMGTIDKASDIGKITNRAVDLSNKTYNNATNLAKYKNGEFKSVGKKIVIDDTNSVGRTNHKFVDYTEEEYKDITSKVGDLSKGIDELDSEIKVNLLKAKDSRKKAKAIKDKQSPEFQNLIRKANGFEDVARKHAYKQDDMLKAISVLNTAPRRLNLGFSSTGIIDNAYDLVGKEAPNIPGALRTKAPGIKTKDISNYDEFLKAYDHVNLANSSDFHVDDKIFKYENIDKYGNYRIGSTIVDDDYIKAQLKKIPDKYKSLMSASGFTDDAPQYIIMKMLQEYEDINPQNVNDLLAGSSRLAKKTTDINTPKQVKINEFLDNMNNELNIFGQDAQVTKEIMSKMLALGSTSDFEIGTARYLKALGENLEKHPERRWIFNNEYLNGDLDGSRVYNMAMGEARTYDKRSNKYINLNRTARKKITDASEELNDVDNAINSGLSKVYGTSELSDLVTTNLYDKAVKIAGEDLVDDAIINFISLTNQTGNAINKQALLHTLNIKSPLDKTKRAKDVFSNSTGKLPSLNDELGANLVNSFDNVMANSVGETELRNIVREIFKPKIEDIKKVISQLDLKVRANYGLDDLTEMLDDDIIDIFYDKVLTDTLRPNTYISTLKNGQKYYTHDLSRLAKLFSEGEIQFGGIAKDNLFKLDDAVETDKIIKDTMENIFGGHYNSESFISTVMNNGSYSSMSDVSSSSIREFTKNLKDYKGVASLEYTLDDFNIPIIKNREEDWGNRNTFGLKSTELVSKEFDYEVLTNKLREQGVADNLMPTKHEIFVDNEGQAFRFDAPEVSPEMLDKMDELVGRAKAQELNKAGKIISKEQKKELDKKTVLWNELAVRKENLGKMNNELDALFTRIIDNDTLYSLSNSDALKFKGEPKEFKVLAKAYNKHIASTEKIYEILKKNNYTSKLTKPPTKLEQEFLDKFLSTKPKLTTKKDIDKYVKEVAKYNKIMNKKLKLDTVSIGSTNIQKDTFELIRQMSDATFDVLETQQLDDLRLFNLGFNETDKLSLDNLKTAFMKYENETLVKNNIIDGIRQTSNDHYRTYSYDFSKLAQEIKKDPTLEDKIKTALDNTNKSIEFEGSDLRRINYGLGELYQERIAFGKAAQAGLADLMGQQDFAVLLDGVKHKLKTNDFSRFDITKSVFGNDIKGYKRSQTASLEENLINLRTASKHRYSNGKLMGLDALLKTEDDIRIPFIKNEFKDVAQKRGAKNSSKYFKEIKGDVSTINDFLLRNTEEGLEKTYSTNFKDIDMGTQHKIVRDVIGEVMGVTIPDLITDYAMSKKLTRGKTWKHIDELFTETGPMAFLNNDQRKVLKDRIYENASSKVANTNNLHVAFPNKDYALMQNRLKMFKSLNEPTGFQKFADNALNLNKSLILFGAFNTKFNLSIPLLMSALEGGGTISKSYAEMASFIRKDKSLARLVNENRDIQRLLINADMHGDGDFKKTYDFIKSTPSLELEDKELLLDSLLNSMIIKSSPDLHGKFINTSSDKGKAQLKKATQRNLSMDAPESFVESIKRSSLFKFLTPNFEPMENAVVIRTKHYLRDEELMRKQASLRGYNINKNKSFEDKVTMATKMAQDDLGVGEGATLKQGWDSVGGMANKAFLFPSFLFRGLPKMFINYMSTGENAVRLLKMYDQVRLSQDAAGLDPMEKNNMKVKDRLSFSMGIPGVENGVQLKLYSPLDIYKSLADGFESAGVGEYLIGQMNPLIVTPLELIKRKELDTYGKSLEENSSIYKFDAAIQSGNPQQAVKYGFEAILNGIGGQPVSFINKWMHIVNGTDRYGNKKVSPENSDYEIWMANQIRKEFGLDALAPRTINDTALLSQMFASNRNKSTSPIKELNKSLSNIAYDLYNESNDVNSKAYALLNTKAGQRFLDDLYDLKKLSKLKQFQLYSNNVKLEGDIFNENLVIQNNQEAQDVEAQIQELIKKNTR